MVRKAIPRVLKVQLWMKYCGRVFDTCCRCCFINPINPFEFHAAHIISVAHGGSTHLDNLLPTCTKCNLSMGIQNLYEFQKQYGYIDQGSACTLL